MGKIIQTAGRNALGEFAPEFAHFNDDVLFGENWNNQDIDVKTRSIITVVALMASGITDSSLKYHLQNAKNHGVTQKEIAAVIRSHMSHSMQVGQKHGLFSILQRKCGRQAKEIYHTKRMQCVRMQKRWYFQSVHQMMGLHSIFLAEVFLHRSPLLRLEFSM
jgi:alkylhydroperoxidase/carboxymuconolactone decarboxylase family protein YurZ